MSLEEDYRHDVKKNSQKTACCHWPSTTPIIDSTRMPFSELSVPTGRAVNSSTHLTSRDDDTRDATRVRTTAASRNQQPTTRHDDWNERLLLPVEAAVHVGYVFVVKGRDP